MDILIIVFLSIIVLSNIIILVYLFLKGNKQTPLESLANKLDEKFDQQLKVMDLAEKSNFEKYDLALTQIRRDNEALRRSFENLNLLLNKKFDELKEINNDFFVKLLKEQTDSSEKIKDKLSLDIKDMNATLNISLKDISTILKDSTMELRDLMDKSIKDINDSLKESLKDVNTSLNNNLKDIRTDNNNKLDEINKVVNEQLQETLEGRLKLSFDNVIEQISGVNKAIGEIKGIANDVGSLKTVLTNVKTKGIVGEVVLGNIISDILTKNQYAENVITKKGSQERVEFAVILPGAGDESIYLPIDSKLPLVAYNKIKEGTTEGDPDKIKEARKELRNQIKLYAKEIKDKYIDVPNTTDFAIMFLPVEGLYIEALDMGLFEEIRKEFKVNLAGPTTLTAILNSLQMGFKTLVIQKRSADIFKLLGAVKTEFEKFADTLSKTQKKVDEASTELDKLVGTRTRMIQSKLKNIDSLDEDESKKILEE